MATALAFDPQMTRRDSMDAKALVHDLVRLRTAEVTVCISEPSFVKASWVKASLNRSPWVVVRRALAPEGFIAVGVRGESRHERWGGFVRLEQIAERARPCDLRTRTITNERESLPAMQALHHLETELSQLTLQWGPGGSVGYEIASGISTATLRSDLDLIIRVPVRFELAFAKDLLATISAAPARVDARVETLFCGFSLQEYCSHTSRKILVRAPTGYALSDDPWGSPTDGESR